MPSGRQLFGGQAERRAADFLLSRGWQILGRHVTSRYGEIDILARDGETVVAVEVKARRTRQFGTGAEAVTPAKLERLAATLHVYLDAHGLSQAPIRIDVISIGPDGAEHLRGVEMPSD